MPYPDPFVLPDLANGSAVPDYRMSDARAFFHLTAISTNQTVNIKEPIGWDGAEWVLERDNIWYGLNFEYSSDEATLTFDEPLAVNFIEEAYHTSGPLAEIRLT